MKDFEKLAVQEIKGGKNWNGKFYEYGKRGTFIYVSGKKFQIVNKDEFLKAVETKKMTYAEAYLRGGMDFAEEGNY